MQTQSVRACSLTLRVQTPPKKVFWGGFGGLNPFSGGTWTFRVKIRYTTMIYHYHYDIITIITIITIFFTTKSWLWHSWKIQGSNPNRWAFQVALHQHLNNVARWDVLKFMVLVFFWCSHKKKQTKHTFFLGGRGWRLWYPILDGGLEVFDGAVSFSRKAWWASAGRHSTGLLPRPLVLLFLFLFPYWLHLLFLAVWFFQRQIPGFLSHWRSKPYLKVSGQKKNVIGGRSWLKVLLSVFETLSRLKALCDLLLFKMFFVFRLTKSDIFHGFLRQFQDKHLPKDFPTLVHGTRPWFSSLQLVRRRAMDARPWREFSWQECCWA